MLEPEYFLDYKDNKGIPTLDKDQWKHLNSLHDKETIMQALLRYIQIYKPEPPVNPVSYEDMVECFKKLSDADYMKFYLPHEQYGDRVMEKYDDYHRPYKDCGLGFIQKGNTYNNVSKYFNQVPRLHCDSYGHMAPHNQWRTGNISRNVLLALWRLGNDNLSEGSFVASFRNAAYIATQFKPHVAKFIYDASNAKTVFDSSCGWGDRLAGFFCSNAREYYGCDPNPETFEMYKVQCLQYFAIRGEVPIYDDTVDTSKQLIMYSATKKVTIWRTPAEDLDYDQLPPIDCAFTSPPYFSTELYNSGGDHEEDQSWSRYDTYEKWRDNFYLPVNHKTYEALSNKGLLMVNIQDPKVHGKRYYASDDLIDYMEKFSSCTFIGNLGMRMMQRAKKQDKQASKEHFEKIYIEPVWVFGKNRDYFMKDDRGLLSFME